MYFGAACKKSIIRMSAIEEWKAIAEYHMAAATLAQKKIEELTPAEDKLLSPSTLKQMVIAFETRQPYKRGWKKAVKDGLITNVQNILEECYHYLLDKNEMGAEFVEKAKEQMGKLDSAKWQRFTLKVIQYLKQQGSFDEEGGRIDTFEDTAGGCDEITQEAVIHLVESA